MTRTYVADITTATTGLQIQIQRPGRLKQIALSVPISAAAGKCEVSKSPTSLIGTAQPDPSSVLARVDLGVGAPSNLMVDCDVPVSTLDRFYIHMTGAANLGTVNLCVVEGGK